MSNSCEPGADYSEPEAAATLYREALELYADPKNWHGNVWIGPTWPAPPEQAAVDALAKSDVGARMLTELRLLRGSRLDTATQLRTMADLLDPPRQQVPRPAMPAKAGA